MNSPQVTVLMSVYNSEKYVRESVSSILAQTFTDFEFVIINDGPTDSSMDIIKSFNDERVKIVENEENIGLTKSLNKGLDIAKGKYVARIDADDIAEPNRLELQVAELESDSNVGLVSSWRKMISEAGEIINTDKVDYTPEDIFYTLHFRNCIIHSAATFRAELVKGLGGYSEKWRHGQDFDLWVRLSKLARIVQIPEYLIQVRKASTSISATKYDDQQNTIRLVVKEGLQKVLGEELTDEQVDVLRAYVVENEFTKKSEIKSLVDRINNAILAQESDIINKLGLDTQLLNKAMQLEVSRYN